MPTPLHLWVPGDFIRASWLNLIGEAIPKRIQIDLGGLEFAGITATGYTRIPGARPFFLSVNELVGYDLSLLVSRYTEDPTVSVQIALCEAANMANVLAQSPASFSTTINDDGTTHITAPTAGIYVVAAAKMSAGTAVGHVTAVSLVGVRP